MSDRDREKLIMDLNKVIGDLHEEKKRLDQIIASLEALQRGSGEVPAPGGKRRGRKFMDASARQEVSRRMKNYWESRRKGEVPTPRRVMNATPGQQA